MYSEKCRGVQGQPFRKDSKIAQIGSVFLQISHKFKKKRQPKFGVLLTTHLKKPRSRAVQYLLKPQISSITKDNQEEQFKSKRHLEADISPFLNKIKIKIE